MRLFKKKRTDTEEELGRLLEEQTGDPAFLQRAQWIRAYEAKDFKTALLELEKAIQLAPSQPIYLALRAMTHFAMDNFEGARADVSAALEADPTQKEAVAVREAIKTDAMRARDQARELGKQQRYRESLGLLDKAAALEPDNPETLFFRGLTYAQLGEVTPALRDVTRTLELDPEYPKAREILQSLQGVPTAPPAKTSPAAPSTSTHFCFVCSGNRSLIGSFYDMFSSTVPDVDVGQYKVNVEAIRSKGGDVSFSGVRFSGKQESPAEKMEDVLRQMGAQATQEVHVFLVNAEGDMYERMQMFYDEILSQAMSQGILPFPMFVTQNPEAKEFVLDLLETVRAS